MQLSNAPGKLLLPFANAGAKNTIPTASQIGITAGAASLTDGFPPLTRTPIAAGGVPPSGLDMNGILYALSAALRWANAGGGYVYDGTFAADSNVGGYPKGARVLRSDGAGYWLNTIDGNTVDPESVTVNAAQVAGWVPDLTNGIAAITMTSANVTLTPAQYGKPIIVLSGVLTANLNLIFPNLAGEWTVVNNCTGAFTVTAKTAAGTGAVVTPGRTRIIWGDGTNIAGAMNEVETPAQFDNTTKTATTAFVQRALGNLNGAYFTTLPTALTLSSIGQCVLLTGAGGLTLPAANIAPNGSIVEIFNTTLSAVTVSRAGSDQIALNGGSYVNSITINPGENLRLCTTGTTLWYAVSGSAQMLANDFGNSLGANGYQKLPSGVIIQWGSGITNDTGDASITFPVAYTMGGPRVNVTSSDATAVTLCTLNGSPINTGFSVKTRIAGGSVTSLNFVWSSVGY